MRPAAEARLVGPLGQGQKVFALFDSGSDYTLAAPWMAMEAGIDLELGTDTGAGGWQAKKYPAG